MYFHPSFAKGARVAIVEVEEIVEVGAIPPERVGLPGVFVSRVVLATKKVAIPKGALGRRAPDTRREYFGKPALSRLEFAKRAAALLPEHGYVNLGSGLPTLVASHVSGRNITLHAENGALGYELLSDSGVPDSDFFDAAGGFIDMRPGGALFDSVVSFEVARSGKLSAVLLGAYQVAQNGDLANWSVPGQVGGGIGGAMDLIAGASKLIIVMEHSDSKGRSRLVRECLMSDFRPAKRTRFDVVGFGLFGAFTLSIIQGLQSLSQDSLQAPIWFFSIAVSALALYSLHASHSQYPLYALSLFRLRSFSVGISGSLMSRLGSGAMPFLTLLMMQVGLGHSPSVAGMSMIPLTVSGMATKPFIGGVIRRFGYRAVLSCNTLTQGVLICSMALVGTETSLWLIIALLSLIGVANYIQFTAMGTVTLIELNDQQASGGTSLMSVITQLSTGLAVSMAGALLVVFNPGEGTLAQPSVMDVFSMAYLSLGALTIMSTLLFLRLPRKVKKTVSS